MALSGQCHRDSENGRQESPKDLAPARPSSLRVVSLVTVLSLLDLWVM